MHIVIYASKDLKSVHWTEQVVPSFFAKDSELVPLLPFLSPA